MKTSDVADMGFRPKLHPGNLTPDHERLFEYWQMSHQGVPITCQGNRKAALWHGTSTEYLEVPALVVVVNREAKHFRTTQSIGHWFFGIAELNELPDKPANCPEIIAEAAEYTASDYQVALDGLCEMITFRQAPLG